MTLDSADRLSSWSLLPGIVDRPRQTLAQVVEYPRWRWVLPTVLCGLSMVILIILTAPLLSDQAQQQQAIGMRQVEAQLGDMTESQRAQLQEQMGTFTSPLFVGGTALVTGILGMLIGWVIGAAILYFGLAMSGVEVGYTPMLTGFSWTWLPFCVQDLVYAGWQFFSGKLIVNPGLSYFVANGDVLADSRNPLWVLTSMMDLFFLWHVFLVYALIKAVRPKGNPLGLTLVYVLLYVLLRLVPALAFGSLMPGSGG